MGPGVAADNLGRLRKSEAAKVIAEGRPATQMAGFAAQLAGRDRRAHRVDLHPGGALSRAGPTRTSAPRASSVDTATLSDKPVFDADPMNLFLVVEAGDHHVSVLDGDRLEPIHRFQSRFALHGGPKFAANGRYVFFASRDGWITKFDLWNLKVVAEVRAGINTRNVAASPDGTHVAVANYLPNTLVLLDGELNLVKTIRRWTATARRARGCRRYDATPRQSFIAALKDVGEVWEISYTKAVEDIPVSYIHDWHTRCAKGPSFPVTSTAPHHPRRGARRLLLHPGLRPS